MKPIPFHSNEEDLSRLVHRCLDHVLDMDEKLGKMAAEISTIRKDVTDLRVQGAEMRVKAESIPEMVSDELAHRELQERRTESMRAQQDRRDKKVALYAAAGLGLLEVVEHVWHLIVSGHL